ncbi:hypothetical protein ABPG74_005208 [Tetrahymena malaccensis]
MEIEKSQSPNKNTVKQQVSVERNKNGNQGLFSKLQKERKNLPIFKHRQGLLDKIKSNQISVIAGETGCGKTTQIPQYLIEEGLNKNRMIAVTQPRRVAAITIAQRVAQEMNTTVGNKVGYSVRFEEAVDKNNTKLLYMTDGMLLRETIVDPNLSRFSIIVIDEAHERTINSDLLISLLKQLSERRKDLKIIIMSATIETEKFANFFETENIIYLEGRCHPIEVFYSKKPHADYLDAALNTILQIHFEEQDGDILCFLVGQEDIEDMQQMLEEKIELFPKEAKKLNICTLYAALPSHLQLLAFEKSQEGERKVVLSTNIAETSVTIDGIKYVVDPGLVKTRKYNPNKLIEMLLVVPVSKSSAMQRAGRAGRQSAGKCFRLYTKYTHDTLAEFMLPEILRSNLSTVILQMKAIGIKDVKGFQFIDRPHEDQFIESIENLQQMNALDANENITLHGKEMAELPLEPIYAHFMLVAFATNPNSISVVLSAISLMQVENLFFIPKGAKISLLDVLLRFQLGNSDQLTKVNMLHQYYLAKNKKSFCKENFINQKNIKKALEVRQQLENYFLDILKKRSKKNQKQNTKVAQNQANALQQSEEQQIQEELAKGNTLKKLQEEHKTAIQQEINTEEFVSCIAKGLSVKAAKLNNDGTYTIIRSNIQAYIHPESLLFYSKPKPEYIIFNEVVSTIKTYLRDITEIQFSDFKEISK